ncbi:MAG: hypothetical protein GXO88_07070 [Chlorobi bacterium]|nr:hypothetical protein [Chlorobiota bacterium]
MPGSGIRSNNIIELFEKTRVSEFHVSERVSIESPMKFQRDDIFTGGLPQIPEYEKREIDSEKIRGIVGLVNGFFWMQIKEIYKDKN